MAASALTTKTTTIQLTESSTPCEEWSIEDNELGSRFVLYYQRHGGYPHPVRLTEYGRLLRGEELDPPGELAKLISYTFRKVNIGEIPASEFLPETMSNCARYPGGFPYFHAFGHYLRF